MKHKQKKEFQPGRGYTKADWDEVSDPHESTDEELAQARPFREAFPDLYASIQRKKAGRPKLERPKQSIALRLDADVLEAFKATGPGWQTRMNEALREWVEKNKAA